MSAGQIIGFVATILTILVSVMTAVYRITNTINRTAHGPDSRLERLEMRIAAVEGQNRAFLQVFPKVIITLVGQGTLSTETGFAFVTEVLSPIPLAELFKDIRPTVNPLSQYDLDTLRAYTERLKVGGLLDSVEAQNFYRITDIITHEYPTNQNGWLLFLLGGVVLGAILADTNKKK